MLAKLGTLAEGAPVILTFPLAAPAAVSWEVGHGITHRGAEHWHRNLCERE